MARQPRLEVVLFVDGTRTPAHGGAHRQAFPTSSTSVRRTSVDCLVRIRDPASSPCPVGQTFSTVPTAYGTGGTLLLTHEDADGGKSWANSTVRWVHHARSVDLPCCARNGCLCKRAHWCGRDPSTKTNVPQSCKENEPVTHPFHLKNSSQSPHPTAQTPEPTPNSAGASSWIEIPG